MKTLTSVAVFAIASVLSFNAMAESKVNKSIILKIKSKNQKGQTRLKIKTTRVFLKPIISSVIRLGL